MMDYALVLTYHPDYVGCLWGMNDNDYATLSWDESNGVPMPSQEELESAWPAVRDARAWGRIRVERDRLLAASDWTQVADAPVDSAAWAVYRQALRDIPQDYATPDEVVWPTAP